MIDLHNLYKCQFSLLWASIWKWRLNTYWSHRENEMSFRACWIVLILAIFTSGKNISRLSQLLQATLSFKYFPFLLNNGKHIPFYCWTSRVLSLCQDQNFDRTSSFCRGPLWFRRFLGLICKVENTQTENKKSNIGSSEEGPTTQKRSQPVTEFAHISPSWCIKAPYDKYTIK